MEFEMILKLTYSYFTTWSNAIHRIWNIPFRSNVATNLYNYAPLPNSSHNITITLNKSCTQS